MFHRCAKSALVVCALFAGCLFAGKAQAEEKTVVFAADITSPPMEYVENDRIVGFGIDLVNAVAKEAGFTAEVKSNEWNSIFAELRKKKYDAIIASVTISEERKQAYPILFSEPYYTVQQALVVRADSTAKNLADLNGQKVGAQVHTTGFFTLFTGFRGPMVETFPGKDEALQALKEGKVEAMICDDPVAVHLVQASNGRLRIAQFIPSTPPEQYGIVVRKDDPELLALINQGLKAVQAKGIDRELRRKWLGQ